MDWFGFVKFVHFCFFFLLVLEFSQIAKDAKIFSAAVAATGMVIIRQKREWRRLSCILTCSAAWIMPTSLYNKL